MSSKEERTSLFRKAQAAWAEFTAVGAATHASSIAYYTFLSLVPLLALCISLVSMVGVDQQQIFDVLSQFVPDALSDLADALVSDAYERSGLAFSVSTLSLIWAASKGAKALRVGLNAAYAEREARGAVTVAAISVAAVVAMGVLIAMTMWLVFSNSVLQALARLVPDLQPHQSVMELADLLVTLVAGAVLLALCYTFLPAGNRRFVAQLPGAAFSLIGCGLLSFGFRVYVDWFADYTVLYGSIAAIAMLLFWMYFVFFILVAGGFINRLAQRSWEARMRSEHRVSP